MLGDPHSEKGPIRRPGVTISVSDSGNVARKIPSGKMRRRRIGNPRSIELPPAPRREELSGKKPI